MLSGIVYSFHFRITEFKRHVLFGLVHRCVSPMELSHLMHEHVGGSLVCEKETQDSEQSTVECIPHSTG